MRFSVCFQFQFLISMDCCLHALSAAVTKMCLQCHWCVFAPFCVCQCTPFGGGYRSALLNFHPPGPLFKFELRSFCLHGQTHAHTHESLCAAAEILSCKWAKWLIGAANSNNCVLADASSLQFALRSATRANPSDGLWVGSAGPENWRVAQKRRSRRRRMQIRTASVLSALHNTRNRKFMYNTLVDFLFFCMSCSSNFLKAPRLLKVVSFLKIPISLA